MVLVLKINGGKMKFLSATLLTSALVLGLACQSEACSRITYASADGSVVTGRSMDWPKTDDVKLQSFPKGEKRSGLGSNPFEWTSKYASIAATSHDFVNSGVNEARLAVDVLYLATSDYGTLQEGEKTITTTMLTQFLLDNFATAQEVADYFKDAKLRPVLDKEFAGHLGADLTVHYIVTDLTGDNTIIEYIDGKPKIHHQKGSIVYTNDPEYDKMLAIRDYFKEAGIEGSMPGSSLSQARFVYLTGWLGQTVQEQMTDVQKEIPGYTYQDQTMATVLSLMRGVSTPFGIIFDRAHPNNSSTLWRTVTDVKGGMFYFDSALTPLTLKIDLSQINWNKATVVNPYKDSLSAGDITHLFK